MTDWKLNRGVKPDACIPCPRFSRGGGFCNGIPSEPPPGDFHVLGVGRSPGPVEGRVGRPYAAGAGRLLDNLLVRAGLSRSKIRMTNLVKCSGPDPTFEEAEFCMKQYFADELADLKRSPHPCIIAIGSMPAKILANIDKVKHERGTVHSFMGVPVVITLEPAGLIWSKSEAKNIGETRDYLPIVIKDLVKVKRISTGHAEVSATRELLPHPTEEQAEEMLARVEKSPSYGCDLETNWPELPRRITMIGLSDRPGAAVTFFPGMVEKYRERLQRIFADPTKMMYGHNNGQADVWWLRDEGWEVNNRLYDSMLADHLVESDMGDFGLEAVSSRWLDYEPWKHLTTKDPMRNCLDVSIQLELAEKLTIRMQELGCYDLLFRHQMPIAEQCAILRRKGIRVDREAMAKAYIACVRIIERYDKTLTDALGPIFNRRSPKQLATLFYDVMKLPMQLHRRTRKPTTDHYALDDLFKIVSAEPKWQQYRPIFEALQSIKQFDNMQSKYLNDAYVSEDGRFHPEVLQHRQVTGRLSYEKPALNQLPKNSIARAMLLPDEEGWVIVSADFSQIQMRVVGDLAGDTVLNERLAYYDANPLDEHGEKQDVHRLHANRFYSDVRLDKTKRSLAKNMYYGVQFGQGARGLAIMYGVEESHAQNFIDFLWREYPRTKMWRDGLLNAIEERNHLSTAYHRIRWLWNRNFATEAFICLPQMTEYDMMAESWLELSKALPSPARVFLTVHDEINVTCPAEMATEVAHIMEEVMSRPRETLNGFRCPASAKIGKNYQEASGEAGMAGDWRRLRRQVR